MLRNAAFALLSAVLLVLAFPPFNLAFLAWVALVPVLIAITDHSPKAAFGLCFTTGISFFMGIFYWINVVQGVTWLDFILLGVYLGAYFGVFGLVYNCVARHSQLLSVVIAPIIWVSQEYVRAHFFFLALPWGLLGHTQYHHLPVIQIAALTGVYGVSFCLVMVNAVLSDVVCSWLLHKPGAPGYGRSRLLRPALGMLGLVGSALVYGFSVLAHQPLEDTVRVTVIQPNIAQEVKWDAKFQQQNLDKHMTLTRNAAQNEEAHLIVWPESAVPSSLTHSLALLKTLPALAKEANAHLLIGSAQRPKFGSAEFQARHWFNSAFLVSPRGVRPEPYHKVYLLPFAEYLPYKEVIPWPGKFVAQAGNFLPGKDYTLFRLHETRFGVLICWESLFPELFRRFVKNGAQFMVNITNEAWFEDTAAPYHFVAMNVFRAVENRIALARAANTGISGFIDPYGRLLGKVQKAHKDTFIEGYLTKDMPLSKHMTLYTMYGDIFAYINILATVFVLIVAFLKYRTKRKME